MIINRALSLLDEKAGKYAFKWIGYDGKEKLSSSSVETSSMLLLALRCPKQPAGCFLYSYEVQNLSTSPTYLKRLIVQNFAADAEPVRNGAFFPGTMSSAIDEFKEGNWISFADVSDDVQIDPGQTVRVQSSFSRIARAGGMSGNS